ncbi:cytochrome P450 [Actinomadura sp. HBU206391]|uniref:cytochrome P450 n=1 Tax=Actinomadura sp. HBU206391 TaxID=2731692 RepID=UPI001650C5A4|nr:cytochrome P450 [Actinomadura sp. HBU206391]MBC6457000.1 cytochrome P450 [Actinomadura sp. HBU206391]
MDVLPRLPFERANPLDVSSAFSALRAEEPVTRVRTATGDEAWLVTGYDEVRGICADQRFGRSHPTPRTAARLSNSALLGGPSGDYATEKAVHARMRRLVAPALSARRMRALAGRVQQLVDDLLDRMEAQVPPVDLRAWLSIPLPVQVICELLGVPYEDRDHFRSIAEDMADLTDPERSASAEAAMREYTGAIVAAKRLDPGADLYSVLAAADLPEDRIGKIAAGLLFAGHETTVNQIDYGVLLLLHNPSQLAALKRDPALAPAAVEEVLRLAAPSEHGLLRYAREDVDIAGITIRAGEAVVLVTVAANRDHRAYSDPDRFDLHRGSGNPHLGFGYAIHHCLGANLARVELCAVFGTLFQRFPELRPAVPVEELTTRANHLTGGFTELLVTW